MSDRRLTLISLLLTGCGHLPQINPVPDDYSLGDLVYHKNEPYLGDGFIDHLTPYAVYVLWQYSPEHINWKELGPKGYGRQFCTKYIIKKTA